MVRIKIIKEAIKKLACEIYIASKTPIPVSLRSFYTIRVYRQAAQQYLLTPYSGKMVLYQFINSSAATHKNNFIECNKETEHYVASGRHSDVVSKSHALAWAEQLKESLEAAQTKSL